MWFFARTFPYVFPSGTVWHGTNAPRGAPFPKSLPRISRRQNQFKPMFVTSQLEADVVENWLVRLERENV